MAAGATDVVVRFLADISDMSKGVQSIDDKISGFGGKLKSWAKGAAAAFGTAFAVDKIRDAIGAASELQDAMSASEQIFGAASKTVDKFASGAATAFGMSKQQAIDAANTFATFGKGAGLAGDDLAGFSTNLTGLAGDLASFRGTTPEQAIEAIGAALRGETEPIRAYGVLLDDASLRQRALKMGLISTTKDALTPQQKVLAAQAEILAQTGDAQGDFARTSDSAANQQKILKANMENLQATIGTAFLPALQMLLPVLSAIAGFIQENAGWLVPLTAAVLGVAAAVWVWNAALAANPIVLVTIAIAALIAGIILLWKNWDAVWSAILSAVDWAVSFILDHWQMIIGIIFPFIGALMLLWNNWDTIMKAMVGAVQWAVNLVISTFNTVLNFFRAIPGWIVSALAGLGQIILAPFNWAWEQIQGIPGKIADVFKGAINWLINAWNNFAIPSFSIGGWSTPFGDLPSWDSPRIDFPDIHPLAKGGIVTKPTLAMIGERGPEAVVPLGSTMGGTTIVVNVTTTGLGADNPSIQRAVVNALRGYVGTNGPLTGIAG